MVALILLNSILAFESLSFNSLVPAKRHKIARNLGVHCVRKALRFKCLIFTAEKISA